MNKTFKTFAGLLALLAVGGMSAQPGRTAASLAANDSTRPANRDAAPEKSIIDEVIWVVGDEPILRSDVEAMRYQGQQEGMTWDGNADCAIPEQIAVQKLFLHQAAIDSIEVSESEISEGVESQINYWLSLPIINGSREKLEQYQKKSLTQMRLDLHDEYKNSQLVRKMQQSLVEDVKVSPAEVRTYFSKLPKDSIPVVPTTVEVEILTQAPRIEQEEINRVKDQLRDYTERVTNGSTSFATLARLYSEDPGSARMGGELGLTGRGMLDPAFATVAFNLTDPNKISKIVETEFGYHIIQLIDKRGDKINCRHILIKPRVSAESIEKAKLRLDSIADDIRSEKFTFEAAASYISDDKDTKANGGLMVNSGEAERTSRFRMQDLPTEVARVVDTLKVGQVSQSFQMTNERGKTVCAIVKLKSRVDEHRATITEDFQTMKDIVMADRKRKIIHDWVIKKVKETYVNINPRYKDCKFEYEGWIK